MGALTVTLLQPPPGLSAVTNRDKGDVMVPDGPIPHSMPVFLLWESQHCCFRLGTRKEPKLDHEGPAQALSCPNPHRAVPRRFVLQPANPHAMPLAFLLLGCLWAQLALGSGWKAGAVWEERAVPTAALGPTMPPEPPCPQGRG